MDRLFTIGVYGWDAGSFFVALAAAEVDELWDVRQRRGVRGRDGAFANATRLQEGLAEHGIGYRHVTELAPSATLRSELTQDDRAAGRRHRDREALPDWFVARYRAEVLDPVDLGALARSDARRPALLCVEARASACHRSVAATALVAEAGVQVEHLSPPSS